MKRTIAATFLFGTAAALCGANSLPSQNSPKIQITTSSEEKQKSLLEQPGKSAEQLSPVLQEMVAELKNLEEILHVQDRSEEDTEFWPPIFGYRFKITDSLLVIFTFGLVYYTRRLDISTRRLWEAGEKQIALARDQFEFTKTQLREASDLNEKQMAIAARQTDIVEKQKEIARQEFLATHRPKLIVRIVTLIPRNGFGNPEVFEVTVANTGEMDAEIGESNISARAIRDESASKEFPVRIPYSDVKDAMEGTIEGGKSVTFTFTSNVVFENGAAIHSLNRGDSNLFLYGYMNYVDERGTEFGISRTTAFCLRYNPGNGRFESAGNPYYEYAD